MKFKELNLKPEVLQVINNLSFKEPTKTQQVIIPLILKNKNILVKSPTGTGKTHSFLIPLFNKVDSNINKVQVIIMSPTRELAKQLFDNARVFGDALNIKISLLSSGIDRNKSKDSLISKVPQIIIGTPGRIKDLAFDNPVFNITSASYLVMDEADMILEEGFLNEVGLICQKLNKNILFSAFSASLPEDLISFLTKYYSNLEYVDLSNSSITNTNVTHVCYPTRNRDRLGVLKYLLEVINPYCCIVFASKKETVNQIYKYLLENNFNCCLIHGDLNSTSRRTTMKAIKEGKYSIIVASDIAARGIDIEGISEVINYDLPYEEEFYFHRAGRTGRANLKGTCYTLYDKDEINKLTSLYKKGVKFINEEYSNGSWVKLKDLFERKRVNKDNPLNDAIREVVNKNKNKKVKPNYKKKQKLQIEKLKRQHKREIIEKDIQRQRKEKYKNLNKGGNYNG